MPYITEIRMSVQTVCLHGFYIHKHLHVITYVHVQCKYTWFVITINWVTFVL